MSNYQPLIALQLVGISMLLGAIAMSNIQNRTQLKELNANVVALRATCK